MGFFAGKYLDAKRDTIAKLLIYIIVPTVIFYGAATTIVDVAILTLPFVFYGICCVLCLTAYAVAGRRWRDSTRNILAYTCGTGNNGYFGLPLVLALFSERAFGIAVIIGMGFLLYETTLGFFIAARGSMTIGDSLKKLMRFPLPYAFALGLLVNVSGAEFPQAITELLVSFRGAYTVLGMMLIGLGLSRVHHLWMDLPFVGFALFFKFICWPLLMAAVILLDRSVLHLYTDAVHQVMLALALVPLAANTVAYATELKVQPEKASAAVLISTLVALVYIPLVVALIF